MSFPQRSLTMYGVVGALVLSVVSAGTVPGAALDRAGAKVSDGSSVTATTASRTLRMPSTTRCVRDGRLRLRIVPPGDDEFSTVRVRMGGVERVRLRGIFAITTVYVNLPRGRTAVRVTASSADGDTMIRNRSYRRCSGAITPSTRPGRPPTVYEGGGED